MSEKKATNVGGVVIITTLLFVTLIIVGPMLGYDANQQANQQIEQRKGKSLAEMKAQIARERGTGQSLPAGVSELVTTTTPCWQIAKPGEVRNCPPGNSWDSPVAISNLDDPRANRGWSRGSYQTGSAAQKEREAELAAHMLQNAIKQWNSGCLNAGADAGWRCQSLRNERAELERRRP